MSRKQSDKSTPSNNKKTKQTLPEGEGGKKKSKQLEVHFIGKKKR